MVYLSGNSWFPIVGHVILRGDKPICSTPHSGDALLVMEALARYEKGQTYTCISKDGYFCKQEVEDDECCKE